MTVFSPTHIIISHFLILFNHQVGLTYTLQTTFRIARPYFKCWRKGPKCMFSNSSQANGTTYVFCYNMVIILHIQNVEYMYFSTLFYLHALKLLPPPCNLILSTT